MNGTRGRDDVLAKLQRLKEDTASGASTILLRPNQGEAVSVPRHLLRRNASFENLFNEQPDKSELTVHASRKTLDTFMSFLYGDQCKRLNDAYEAILLGCAEFMWDEFVDYCCKAAMGLIVPNDSKPSDVSAVISALIDHLPLRAYEHYEAIVNDSTAHLSPTDKALVIDSVITSISKKATQIAEPLPVPLFVKQVTVAWMIDFEGRQIVAIYHEGKWLRCDIFGPEFSPEQEDVSNFHVVYQRYVVYEKSDHRILMKSLDSNEPPQTLLDKCKFFRSRCNQLHVICKGEDNADCLYEWETSSMSFVKKFSHPTEGLRSAHRRQDGCLVVVLESGYSLEVSATEITVGRTSVLDCIEDCWQARDGNSYKIPIRELSYGRYGRSYEINKTLAIPIHVGYTRLNAVLHESGFYKTQVYNENWEQGLATGLHGSIKSFSDVLLV